MDEVGFGFIALPLDEENGNSIKERIVFFEGFVRRLVSPFVFVNDSVTVGLIAKE
jgi:hypothetical protein